MQIGFGKIKHMIFSQPENVDIVFRLHKTIWTHKEIPDVLEKNVQ